MQQIIYTSQFSCELCNKNLPVQLYGDRDSSFTAGDEPELVDWAKHYHWIDYHRVCAVCGKLVLSGDLELALNSRAIKIHEDYTDEYKKVKWGDQFGHLLIVHEACIKNKN